MLRPSRSPRLRLRLLRRRRPPSSSRPLPRLLLWLRRRSPPARSRLCRSFSSSRLASPSRRPPAPNVELEGLGWLQGIGDKSTLGLEVRTHSGHAWCGNRSGVNDILGDMFEPRFGSNQVAVPLYVLSLQWGATIRMEINPRVGIMDWLRSFGQLTQPGLPVTPGAIELSYRQHTHAVTPAPWLVDSRLHPFYSFWH